MTFLDDSILRGGKANSRAALVQIALGLAGTSSDGPLIFDLTSGEQAAPPRIWPAGCRIGGSTQRASLLVFADPYSDSTRAALDELARILERAPEDKLPAVHILFSKPGYAERWTPDDLWARAAALPGAIVSWDAGGHQAALFGGETSCTVLVYGCDGVLRFAGESCRIGGKAGAGDLNGRFRLPVVKRWGVRSPDGDGRMKNTARFKTSIPARSTMRILLEPMGGSNSPIYCSLIGIERGQIHLNIQKWLEPGTRAVLKIDGIAVSGEIEYCNRKTDEYRTCFTLGHRRSAPRFPIDEPGSLTVLGDEETLSSACRLTDLSLSGLGLTTSTEVKVGAMICVHTGSMLAVGEVRHRRQESAGTFHVGVEVTDVLANEAERRQGKGLRQRLAEFILGYRINPLQARH